MESTSIQRPIATSANLRVWAGQTQASGSDGIPRVFYHGTASEFEEFNPDITWVSFSPDLANDYAFCKAEILAAAGLPSNPRVIPVFVRVERPFYADGPATRTVNSFFNDALVQSLKMGAAVDLDAAKKLLMMVRQGASQEQSGPSYSTFEFWHSRHAMFGQEGAEAIEALFRLMNFDSICLHEDGVLTYGVFSPSQLKSAIGNSGRFDPNNPSLVDLDPPVDTLVQRPALPRRRMR